MAQVVLNLPPILFLNRKVAHAEQDAAQFARVVLMDQLQAALLDVMQYVPLVIIIQVIVPQVVAQVDAKVIARSSVVTHVLKAVIHLAALFVNRVVEAHVGNQMKDTPVLVVTVVTAHQSVNTHAKNHVILLARVTALGIAKKHVWVIVLHHVMVHARELVKEIVLLRAYVDSQPDADLNVIHLAIQDAIQTAECIVIRIAQQHADLNALAAVRLVVHRDAQYNALRNVVAVPIHVVMHARVVQPTAPKVVLAA